MEKFAELVDGQQVHAVVDLASGAKQPLAGLGLEDGWGSLHLHVLIARSHAWIGG